MAKKHDIKELNALYTSSDSIDKEVFAEQRSNLLLVSGEHYNRKMSKFSRRLRDARDLSSEQKLRLTKNHIQNICKIYANHLISASPGVGFMPKQENELQDQKSAEMHHAVWLDARDRYDFEEKNDDWADDFFNVGEVATKIFWDENAGEIVGYNQHVDDEGSPQFEEDGSPSPNMDSPVFSGAFIFEDIYGFNLLRAQESKKMSDSHFHIIRKMVDKDDLLAKYQDEDQQKMIVAGYDETYMVFDASRSSYSKAKNQVLIREFYFKSCVQYPDGYYYITTKEGILNEGPLPGGIYPIIFGACNRKPTSPRGVSIIKTMRPYQAEINRSASKIAEHQITLGDDKLLIQNGTKVTAGASLPGIRTANYTGMKPDILPGRSGAQYLDYMLSQIKEMYQVMQVAEMWDDTAEKGQMDPYALLFRSAAQKKRFQRYVRRYSRFLKNVVKTHLKLAKIYMPDDAVIRAVGKNEQVNISEFKNSHALDFEVVVEEQSDDIETKMGKQLVLNHVLQYVGPQLGKDSIGMLINEMPYANVKGCFSDLIIDNECATNDILALDRGKQPPIHQYDKHQYLVQRAVARMRQADFDSLNPQIQQNYASYIQAHEQSETERMQQLKAAESEFIPTGGYLVTCDLYLGTDQQDPSKVKRARIPYESLQWLLKQLDAQGSDQQALSDMNQGALAQIAGHFMQSQQGGPQAGMQAGHNIAPIRAGVGNGQPGNSAGPAVSQSNVDRAATGNLSGS